MFDPTAFKSYRYHSTMLYIDESTTISDIKAAQPNFFKRSHGARSGERRTMHRGHLIVTYRFTASDRSVQPMMAIYAWDMRTEDTHCISTDNMSVREAKQFINEKLDTPEPQPLRLTEAIEEINVPVKVKATVFRDAEGKVTDIQLGQWLKVGEYEVTDRRPEIDKETALASYVQTHVCRSLAKTVVK